MHDIQDRMRGAPLLAEPQRYLVREGGLSIVRGPGKSKALQVFLFNDLLVVAIH